MDEKKMNNDTEMNVGMLEDALIDTLKEVTIKFSKDSYICRILTDTIHLINRQKEEIERLTEENSKLRIEIVSTLNEKAELQKQVDELTAKLQCPTDITEAVKNFVSQAVKDTAVEALEQFICECLDEHIVGVNDKEYMQMLELKDDILRECYGVEVE